MSMAAVGREWSHPEPCAVDSEHGEDGEHLPVARSEHSGNERRAASGDPSF